MKNETKYALGVFAILVVVLVVIGSQRNSIESVTGAAITQPTQGSSIPKGEIREFSIKTYMFGYDPGTITVNQGDTVRLKLTSLDVPHGFGISKYGISEYVRPGSEATVEFVADKTGTFSYYCTVPCGSGHGRMGGKVIVK